MCVFCRDTNVTTNESVLPVGGHWDASIAVGPTSRHASGRHTADDRQRLLHCRPLSRSAATGQGDFRMFFGIRRPFVNSSSFSQISESWWYVAMVLDRLLLILFSTVNIVGTILILTQSPSLTDTREPFKVRPPTKPLSGDTFVWSSANLSGSLWW